MITDDLLRIWPRSVRDHGAGAPESWSRSGRASCAAAVWVGGIVIMRLM